jgi:FkbM family methyltransferase
MRTDTTDTFIADEIFGHDEYKLSEKMLENEIVIDAGAHIGLFTEAVMQCGAQRVYAIEANRENYEIACLNLEKYTHQGRVVLTCGALWRSDSDEKVLYCSDYKLLSNGLLNTGGCDVLWQKQGLPIPAISLDTLLMKIVEKEQKTIRLLKIDCEGAEWPILFTAQKLQVVQEVCGEFHEYGGEFDSETPPFSVAGLQRFTIEELIKFFEERAFSFTYSRRIDWWDHLPTRWGMFFAEQHFAKPLP